MSSSLRAHGLRHARPPCPSPTPGACSNLSIESVMSSNHLILCHPLLLLLTIIPNIRVFSNQSVLCIRWPKDWSFNFNISVFNEYSWLISFRIDWFDFLAVQETLKSLLQHHSSKASILWHSGFFMVHLWKTFSSSYHHHQLIITGSDAFSIDHLKCFTGNLACLNDTNLFQVDKVF